jgi:tetratricopeptide (TPR) repeat protein
VHKSCRAILNDSALLIPDDVPGRDCLRKLLMTAKHQRVRWIEDELALVYAHLGRAEEARAILRRFESLGAGGKPVLGPAEIYIALGDREKALLDLEQALARLLVGLGVDPRFKPIRGDPSFQALLRRIGLPNQVARQSHE